jgi:hypothetical protein
MKIIFFFFALILFQSCSSSSSKNRDKETVEKLITVSLGNNIFQDDFKKEQEIYDQVFFYVMDSTYYQNPTLLIEQLGIFYGQKNVAQTTIVAFERQQLYGIPDSVWFINCKSTLEGYGCAYPTMHTQYLFNNQGRLIHKNQAAFAKFIPVIKEKPPLYMSIDHDCDGNGQHHFYIHEHGKLIDIFNVLMNDTPKTFDSNPNKGMFKKNYLTLLVKDVNEDGHNDIVLKGKWLILESETGKKYNASRPFKTELLEYSFLYKPTKEYFLIDK